MRRRRENSCSNGGARGLRARVALRDPIVPSDTITLLISKSGETADTIAAQDEAKAKGSNTGHL